MANNYDFLKKLNDRYGGMSTIPSEEPIDLYDPTSDPERELEKQKLMDLYASQGMSSRGLGGQDLSKKADSDLADIAEYKNNPGKFSASQASNLKNLLSKLNPTPSSQVSAIDKIPTEDTNDSAFNNTVKQFEEYPTEKSYEQISKAFENETPEQPVQSIPKSAPSATEIEQLSPSIQKIEAPVSQTEDLMARYKAALAQRDKEQDSADWLKMLGSASNALTGTNVNILSDLAASKEKRAAQGISDIDDKMKLEKGQIDLTNESELSDPNSAASKLIREEYNRIFPANKLSDNISAAQLKAQGVNLGMIATAAENRASRAETAMERRIEKERAKEDKKSLVTERNIDTFKARERDRVAKIAKDYNSVHSSVTQLENLLKNPSGYGDTLALFKLMRAADPGSTVRESEYRTAQNVGSLAEQISNRIQEVTSGKKLQESQRQDLLNAVKKLKAGIKESTEDFLAPIKEDAKSLGVEEKYFLPTSLRSVSEPIQQSPTVRIRDPKGNIRNIDVKLKEKALAAGGTLVE
jgi:hypothetical protein